MQIYLIDPLPIALECHNFVFSDSTQVPNLHVIRKISEWVCIKKNLLSIVELAIEQWLKGVEEQNLMLACLCR